jgi:tricorn protease
VHAQTVNLPRYPAASPDGTVLTFSWRGDLWKVPGSGGAAVRLTANPSNEGRSAFSPDGTSIVFDSDRDGGRNLFIMKSDGSAVRQLTFGDSAAILSGCGLDAAGRPVAYFESARDNDLYRATRPFMVPLDGGPVERVTDAFGGHPVASAAAAHGTVAPTRARTSATCGCSTARPAHSGSSPTGRATTAGRFPPGPTSST